MTGKAASAAHNGPAGGAPSAEALRRAEWGKWGEPATILVYGDSGLGKSADAIKLLPLGLHLAMPGALKPAISMCGWRVNEQKIETISQATQYVEWAYATYPFVFPGVVVDDLTLLAKNEAADLRQKYDKKHNFDYYEAIKTSIHNFTRVCKRAGMHLVCSAHIASSGTDNDGNFYKGGPEMPVAKLIKAVPHMFDVSMRVGIDPQRKPFQTVYHCQNGHPAYHEKDRHNTFQPTCPMNLREGLLLAGYKFARPPGLEWLDDLAAVVDEDLTKRGPGEFPTIWGERLQQGVKAGLNVLHLRWGLQDGRDRLEFREAVEAARMRL